MIGNIDKFAAEPSQQHLIALRHPLRLCLARDVQQAWFRKLIFGLGEDLEVGSDGIIWVGIESSVNGSLAYVVSGTGAKDVLGLVAGGGQWSQDGRGGGQQECRVTKHCGLSQIEFGMKQLSEMAGVMEEEWISGRPWSDHHASVPVPDAQPLSRQKFLASR